MARQPTVVLNAALPKTVDTRSGIDWFRRTGGLAIAPDLMQSHKSVLSGLECQASASSPQSQLRSGLDEECC